MGSLPHHLFWQFIIETAIITLLAVIIAIGLAQLSLPFINQSFQFNMRFNWTQLSIFITSLTVIFVFL
jgi:ABC-type antimicrobial peptide transport system permease subunit